MNMVSLFLLLVAVFATACAAQAFAELVVLHAGGARAPHGASFSNGLPQGPFQAAVTRVMRCRPIAHIHMQVVGRRRAYALQQAMPDALRLLSTSLSAGNSLEQALRYTANNCADPLSGELRRAVNDIDAGLGFDDAMERLRGRTCGSEFAYLAVAMEIQHASGGSLGEVLRGVGETLSKSAKLAAELKTKTSQGRLSARVVTVMPIVIVGLLSVFSGNYLARFFTSAAGVVMLVLAVALEVVGVLLVRKMLAVDVGGR